MKQKLLLVASLAVGLLAAILARAWVNARNAEVEAEIEAIRKNAKPVLVLAASRPLTAGTKIEMSDLANADTPQAAVGSDNITADDLHRVVGRTIKRTLSKGDPILWTYLEGGRDIARKLSEDVSSGMRAISIPVSGAAAVSGLVRPSDHVDVLATFATGLDKDNPELVTMTVVQNVTVLATGTETSRSRSASASSSGSYGTVTLLVASLTLMILAFSAANHGRLWCNAVCPVGTLLGLVSRFAFFKPVFDLEKCNGCGICSRKCKAECIDPTLHQIDLSRCVACYDCVEACRQKAISIGLYGKTAQEVPTETSKEAEK